MLGVFLHPHSRSETQKDKNLEQVSAIRNSTSGCLVVGKNCVRVPEIYNSGGSLHLPPLKIKGVAAGRGIFRR
ncbi:hypothetical protein EJB05_16238 [Eragrostis curvula]|uniref:Uncharacterized protein n=1 Tax=Eragrostis curvula TaxID=38414 RepID=A0A5J9VEI9_9POAL|nr:hypothetical protein EJB05_16238 [Eragrostis curvula]